MASTSVSGLVSGLDTSTIISQLMQLEAQPQTNLKNRVSDQQKQVTSLQTVNAKIANVATRAGELAKVSAWSPMKVTSSSDKVTVATSASASPSSLTFTVNQAATSTVHDYGQVLLPTRSRTTCRPP